MLALDGLWQINKTSREMSEFIDKAFRLATDSKLNLQSRKTIKNFSTFRDSEQVFYDSKTKTRFKSFIQGDFFHRGNK
jgi:glutaredoxin-related protein